MFVNLPKVDEVDHGSQGGESEAPHEDEGLRVGEFEQQVFEEPAGGGEHQPVRGNPLAIFADQGDIGEVDGGAQVFVRGPQVWLELIPLETKDFRAHHGWDSQLSQNADPQLLNKLWLKKVKVLNKLGHVCSVDRGAVLKTCQPSNPTINKPQ